jgi:probable F420-dependent oxidoreductase
MSLRKPTVGITTYNYPPQELLQLARAAEALGFDGLWFGEHYVVPGARQSVHPGLAAGERHDEDAIVGKNVRLYDPWFLLGAIAGATTHLKIGTAICIAPMLHPLFLARASATAHDVSNGRFRLGLGAGWLREEFDAFDIPFEARGARLDETIDVIRQAWAGGYFEHKGPNFKFESLQITPHAVDVPLVCGGNSGPALRRVARVADAWMNSAKVSLEDALKLREGIEAAMTKAGRTRPLTYFIRPQSAEADLVEQFVRSGFENIVLWGPEVWPTSAEIPTEEKTAGLQRVALALGLVGR